MRRPATLTFTAFCCAVAFPVFAQSTAEQAAPPPPPPAPDVQLFKSPMVVTIPLGPFAGLFKKKWIAHDDMNKFQCDVVTIYNVRLRGRELGDDSWELEIEAKTKTASGHDKWIHFLTELMVDGSVIATDEIADVKSEEDSEGHGDVVLNIPKAKVASGGAAALRLTVTVSDDCCPPRLHPPKGNEVQGNNW